MNFGNHKQNTELQITRISQALFCHFSDGQFTSRYYIRSLLMAPIEIELQCSSFTEILQYPLLPHLFSFQLSELNTNNNNIFVMNLPYKTTLKSYKMKIKNTYKIRSYSRNNI